MPVAAIVPNRHSSVRLDRQVICYSVLDITAKVVFGFIITSSHEAIAQVMQGQAYVVIEPADNY